VATASDLEGDRVHGSPSDLEGVSCMSDTQRRKLGTEATTSCSVATLMKAPAAMGLMSLQPEDRELKPGSVASLMEAPELRTWRRDISFWDRVGVSTAEGRDRPRGAGEERTWAAIL
jgi:hypothetical protein